MPRTSTSRCRPEVYNRVAGGQPGLWCQWAVCWDGCRRDNKHLFGILVEDNEVSEQTLCDPDPRFGDRPPLPYEAAIDRDRAQLRRVRRAVARPPVGNVVDLRQPRWP